MWSSTTENILHVRQLRMCKHWRSWSRSTRYCATSFGLAMPPTQYIDVIPWEKRLHSSRKLRGNSKKWKGTRRRQNWNRELGKYCGISLYREGGQELEGRNAEVRPSWDWDWPVVNLGHRWDLKSFGVDRMTTCCGDPRGERISLIFLIQEQRSEWLTDGLITRGRVAASAEIRVCCILSHYFTYA